MSELLQLPPYAERDDIKFLTELNLLTAHHAKWCNPYKAILELAEDKEYHPQSRIEDLPFVHASLFKHLTLSTQIPDGGLFRTVLSTATSGKASRIQIDEKSSRLQSISSESILADFIGHTKRPLLILDSVQSLRRRNDFSARIIAAMSLKPFASKVFFLLKDPGEPTSLLTQQLECALAQEGDLLVYGFSWILWLMWTQKKLPENIRQQLASRTITYVHSGGWKKLEDYKIDRSTFEQTLLAASGPSSSVVDYYGLVEQMGIVFPLCSHGSRHVPRWADVLVRDSHTHEVLTSGEGQLQIINTISWGSPCHSVLTEDVGRRLYGRCSCGRAGHRFELIGRLPKAELRGCANV